MLNLSLNLFKVIRRNLFPFYNKEEIKFIFETLQKGFSKDKVVARFVGGCVRNHLSGNSIDDIDIATILKVDEIKKRFENTKIKVIDTGIKHGTVTLVSKNNKYEVTTLRKDIKTDGRHAEVEYTDDWKLDSERRDFTINSIYLDINGKIFDPQSGSIDLKNNNVKFIGDPQKRIEEDFLRIIRFLRFKIMYNIQVEQSTSRVIKQNLDGIKKISKERILVELLKILNHKNFLRINESPHLKEIFSKIFPEFLYLTRLDRLKKIPDLHQLDKHIFLAVLLIDEKDNHEYFAHKYNISSKTKEYLSKLATNLREIKSNKNFLDRDLPKNIYIFGKDHLINLNLIDYASRSKFKTSDLKKIIKRILQFNLPKFPFNGNYLIKRGMKEGELLGKVLKIIEDEWVKNDFKISNERVSELISIYKN